MLDDLGLGPSVKTLIDEFSQRTGTQSRFETVVFRNRLDNDSKIALYRVAQEAFTNIERHANANLVTVKLKGTRGGALMKIIDDGEGFVMSSSGSSSGLGLRNMQERIEQLGGTLTITSGRRGTKISALVPLSHILSPQSSAKED
jgi:two-component system NarL family sensor kinase